MKLPGALDAAKIVDPKLGVVIDQSIRESVKGTDPRPTLGELIRSWSTIAIGNVERQ